MPSHPYTDLPPSAFWKPAIAERGVPEIEALWQPKSPVSDQHQVVTFGSCFAQHLGRALRARGYRWLNAEKGPKGMSLENLKRFNYGVFSARTGNIYTTSLFNQWVDWALRGVPSPEEAWAQDGRYYDPFRPRIEPNGFESCEEMLASRAHTIERVKAALTRARVLIFTLGLTESWWNKQGEHEYPLCPGVAAGKYKPNIHKFRNQGFQAVARNLREALEKIREDNCEIRVILTISPVPLTATYSGRHVLVATAHSKAILRAVAGQLSNSMDFVDYFPSYELITHAPLAGSFFESNQRDVSERGVDFVMAHFFAAQSGGASARPKSTASDSKQAVPQEDNDQEDNDQEDKDVVCEERLLEAFGSRS